MSLQRDDGAGHEVVQKDLQGSGEVGLILQGTIPGSPVGFMFSMKFITISPYI